jgi:hypothetical protein
LLDGYDPEPGHHTDVLAAANKYDLPRLHL